MTDVILGLTTSGSTSAAKTVVTWVKNGGTPFVIAHAGLTPNSTYQISFLQDTGAPLVDGDVVSATVAEVDSTGVSSTVVTPVPPSITVPNTPPDPPTNVTLSIR